MAIDTKEKLLSVMNLGYASAPKIMIEPDNSISKQDQSHWLGLYHGITLSGVFDLALRFTADIVASVLVKATLEPSIKITVDVEPN